MIGLSKWRLADEIKRCTKFVGRFSDEAAMAGRAGAILLPHQPDQTTGQADDRRGLPEAHRPSWLWF